jgi:uncharacterized protein (DUF1800 family)/uncharacterized protein (DUF1501 family)
VINFRIGVSALVLCLSACTGSGENDATNSMTDAANGGQQAPELVDTIGEQQAANDDAFANLRKSVRFLNQATFGANADNAQALIGKSASQWFQLQLAIPASGNLEQVQALISEEEELNLFNAAATTIAFWRNSIAGQDQLRQRMAFALSQILVVSNAGGEELTDIPSAVAYYQQILSDHAFGNYRDLLEAVTYSPAMGYYLTYLGNEKSDPESGRMPDENYAREIMQLFSIGLVELQPDGTPKLDGNGSPIETYSNTDITGLARVFTGLVLPEEIDERWWSAWSAPMVIDEAVHSDLEKSFLGVSIPAGTAARESISLALDALVNHPNTPPFIARQLIQRFVSSHPTPDYINRVATAFSQGRYRLPDGSSVGDGRRGDLAATLAAVLFDQRARSTDAIDTGGKIREPILRFTGWARAFDVPAQHPELMPILWETESPQALGQHPYRSPSVFNFYRPGYQPPATLSAAAGMTVPEMQIVNASSLPGYANFMTWFVYREMASAEFREELSEIAAEVPITLDFEQASQQFYSNYDEAMALANQPSELLDYLTTRLGIFNLSTATADLLLESIAQVEMDSSDDMDGAQERVMRTLLMLSVLLPPRLFSHNDQQATWMSSSPEGATRGWGGGFIDAMLAASANTNPEFSVITSGGNDLFLTGQNAVPYQISLDGASAPWQLEGIVPGSREHDIFRMLHRAETDDSTALIRRDYAQAMRNAFDSNNKYNTALTSAALSTAQFPASYIGQQLKSVANAIAIRDNLGVRRQVFIIGMGGFDTHDQQASDLPQLHSQLDEAITAFYNDMQSSGLGSKVTLFTASDFGRTLAVNGDGTDHGWGGHQFVIGDAVAGGQIYGELPTTTPGHLQDSGSGRLIPTTSVEQFAAPLGRWFGLNESEIANSLPRLTNFSGPPGFMG